MIKGVPTSAGRNQYFTRGSLLRPGKLFPSPTQNAVSITMKEQPIEMMCVRPQAGQCNLGAVRPKEDAPKEISPRAKGTRSSVQCAAARKPPETTRTARPQ